MIRPMIRAPSSVPSPSSIRQNRSQSPAVETSPPPPEKNVGSLRNVLVAASSGPRPGAQLITEKDQEVECGRCRATVEQHPPMSLFFEVVRDHPQDRALAASPLPNQKHVAAVA